MKVKNLHFNPSTGGVRTTDSTDAARAGKAADTELHIEAHAEGVTVSTPLGAMQLRDGALELPGGARVEVTTGAHGKQLALRAEGAQQPLLYKLGVDGLEEVKQFGAGVGEVLKFLEGGLAAALDERSQKPVAGTVVATRDGEALKKLGGVAVEATPQLTDAQWALRERAVMDKILADPVKEYSALRARLEQQGPMAPFPEFEPVVARLLNKLRAMGPAVAGDVALARHHQIAMTKLVHAGLKFRVDAEDYPYRPPFEAPYPYKQTLDAIKGAIEFCDVLATRDNTKDALPLYHTDRYQYHWDQLTLDGRTVVFPTLLPLGFEDLIKTRAVPLGFMGVATETVFVDRHRNSPLEFFIHDVNHVRRMVGYSDRALERAGVKGTEQELSTYARWQAFIDDTLLPLVTVKGKSGDANLTAHMVRLIVFELLHEYAAEPTAHTMLALLSRKVGDPDPYEHMLPPGAGEVALDAQKIEAIRNPVGNVHSGAEELGFPTGNVTVRFFMDRAVVILANIYNKMAFGFYDEFDDPKGYVAPPAERTPENLARAAVLVYQALGVNDVSYQELLQQTRSQEGRQELFQAYPKTEGVPKA